MLHLTILFVKNLFKLDQNELVRHVAHQEIKSAADRSVTNHYRLIFALNSLIVVSIKADLMTQNTLDNFSTRL